MHEDWNASWVWGIVQSSKFRVEFIWFISMLITNDAFLILLKLLVLSIAKKWGTLLRYHTQLIQLGFISVTHSLYN